MVGFAEQCLVKLPIKGPQHDAEGNMSPRWKQGIFVGYSRDSNAYVFYTPEGMDGDEQKEWDNLRQMLKDQLEPLVELQRLFFQNMQVFSLLNRESRHTNQARPSYSSKKKIL